MRQKQRCVPWINDDYLVLARQWDYCRKQFGKTTFISWWHKYQYFRNRANNVNRFLKKKKYYQDKFQNCGNENWKVLTKLIPKKKKIVNDVKLMIGNDQVPNKQIADVLNKVFNEVGLRLHTPSGNTSEGELNSLQTLSMPTCEFKLCPIKEEYVLKELLSIDCSKAVGVDGIHPKLLKLAAAYIAEPLTHLFNATLYKHALFQKILRRHELLQYTREDHLMSIILDQSLCYLPYPKY